MKVLVVGAGVIGSFNAARLLRGGVDVTLLARGERLAALREHGVELEDCLRPLGDRLHAVRMSRPVGGAAGGGSASGASPGEMRPSTCGPVSSGTWCQARKPISAIR